MDSDQNGPRERARSKRQTGQTGHDGLLQQESSKSVAKTYGRTSDGTALGLTISTLSNDAPPGPSSGLEILSWLVLEQSLSLVWPVHLLTAVFVVPQTHDMVSQLFSPSSPKNASDAVVVAMLGLLILGLYVLPSDLRIPVYAMIFLFWRACYNVGIGYLLHVQSKHLRLVAWARKTGIFTDPTSGKNAYPGLFPFLKREMETKIPEDYNFEKAPLEYNTWLLFRRVVDLILMCDFVSYCLFALACSGTPANESVLRGLARWSIGLGLFGFNLWVKLDAHRVVKDYAWYWGDFFFLVDQQLTFDGVFEMAPHPMYSIGYAGYYGISLMAASYKVLIISIIAHAAQFAFLIWIENPHIEKTYNPPAPRQTEDTVLRDSDDVPPASIHNLLGIANFDLYRVADASVMLLVFSTILLTILTPNTPQVRSIFVANALLWRAWYSLGIGYILKGQSSKRRWTRHFLKYGGSTDEAWHEWKGIYHIAMIMCYASFAAVCWKLYTPPADWTTGFFVLKHVVGAGLIALQAWTAISIYESLGEYGWFFGDFFFPPQSSKLTYSGIYRYLNNPERVIGLAGVWGAALITSNMTIVFLAASSHALTLFFIHLVERPHMQKLYGPAIRSESGLTKTLRKALPPRFAQFQGSVDRILENTLDSVEDLIDAARPKVLAGVSSFVRDTTAVFKHPARISITRLPADLAGLNPDEYSVGLADNGTLSSVKSNVKSEPTVPVFNYGVPIRIKWTAPRNHSKKDWIGLYRIADNPSRNFTRTASHGRWVATARDHFGSIIADQGILVNDSEGEEYSWGEMQFSQDKLWWRTGVFEFRYHHNGRHTVMATSVPFEIQVQKFDFGTVDNPDITTQVMEKNLLRLVQDCFDRDPNTAPSAPEDAFGGLVERDGKYAKRVVYALHQMFGIEFAPEIVTADGNVRNLAWRVREARRVLQPFMSLSNGRASPADERSEDVVQKNK